MICVSSKYPFLERDSAKTTLLTQDGHNRPEDIYIAIMGMTGSGKSSLIATCCPDAAGEIGHELESSTEGASPISYIA